MVHDETLVVVQLVGVLVGGIVVLTKKTPESKAGAYKTCSETVAAPTADEAGPTDRFKYQP